MIRLSLKNIINSEDIVTEFFLNISGVKIILSILPKGIRFQIYKFGNTFCDDDDGQTKKEDLTKVYFFEDTYPEDLTLNKDFVCSFSYSAEHKQARILVNDKASKPVDIDLGWVTLVDMKPKPRRNSDNFYLQFLFAYKGICRKRTNQRFLSLTPEDTLLSNNSKTANYGNPFAELEE